MRLFLGTFLGKDLLNKIPFEDIEKLFEEKLKPVKKENVHLTWIFLGNVEDGKLNEIIEAIEVNKSMFEGLIFTSSSLIFWPPRKSPRLIVVDGKLNREIKLDKINNDLEKICNPDARDKFLPHITIARFKKDETVSKGFILPKVEDFRWEIKEISLVKSTLTSEGPNYERIKNWT